MLALVAGASLLAFSPPASLVGHATARTTAVEMSESRRAFVGTLAAAAATAPLAAFADGAASPAVRERARALYGSRVARLANAPVDKILEEKNAFTLFTTGAYRSDAASKDKRTKLTALSKKAIASAKAGDAAGAQAAVKEFVSVGEIKILDDIEFSIYNPKQRRNAGAPATQDVEAQMGTQVYALYEAKPKTGKVVGK